jgi:subtilisin family serine protease
MLKKTKIQSQHLSLAAMIILLLVLCSGVWRSQKVAAMTRTLEPDVDSSSEILIKFGTQVDAQHIQRSLASSGLAVTKRIPRINVWLATGHETSAASLARQISQRDDVLWAEPNGLVHASGEIIPDDNFYQAQQWNLRQIGLPAAWAFTTGITIPIAIIDTGIDLNHADLAAKIWTNTDEIPHNAIDDDSNGYVDDIWGWNFINDSTLMLEAHHGTHIAGIAGAQTNNAIGVAGVSWQASLMSLQALRSNGDGSWADVAEAIIYAADNGARILNLSFGGAEPSQTIQDAVTYAREQGCLLVASSGNSNFQPTPVEYPAAFPGVLAVAATTASDGPATFSNRGPEVDIAAPGTEIFSTGGGNRYMAMSGTSMAAPHVSGLAALVWSVEPTLTADQVANVITSTAHDVYTSGWDQYTGWGRIDAHAAILMFESYPLYLPVIECVFLDGF